MKNIAIIGGIILILGTIGLFAYILVIKKAEDQTPQVTVGTGSVVSIPTSGELPSSTGIQPRDGTPTTQPSSPSGVGSSTASSTLSAPRAIARFTELTTDAVAGMTFLSTSTVRYMTRGTGSVVDVAFDGSILASASTRYTGVLTATFSRDGSRIIATVHDAGIRRFLVGVIAANARGQNELRGSLLPANTRDAVFADVNGNIRYLLATARGAEIHTYAPTTRVDTFETLIPYTDAHLTVASSSTYIYTTPSYAQNGVVHRYTQKSLGYVLPGGRGLTATAYSHGVLTTLYRNTKLSTFLVSDKGTLQLRNIMKTDACTELAAHTTILCARPYVFPEEQYPDSWYTGETTHDDTLFNIDTDSGEVSIVASPFEETGQIFDITRIVAHPTTDNQALVLNKNDASLWLFTNNIDAQE